MACASGLEWLLAARVLVLPAMAERVSHVSYYVILNGRTAHGEVWRKNDRARWELAEEAGPAGDVHLASVDVTLDVAALSANPIASLPT